MTINFIADQLYSIHEKEEKMNSTLLHKIRWPFGTGRKPEGLKEADSQLTLLALVWKYQSKTSQGI